MAISQRIGSVEMSFQITGRGPVVVPNEPWEHDPRIGDLIQLLLPDGRCFESRVRGIEIALWRGEHKPPLERRTLLIDPLPDFFDHVPIGTEVLLVSE